jgi:hypothetical protein
MRDLQIDVALAEAVLPASRDDVAELFWDVEAWHAIWHGIDDVAVLYDDRAHQEFVMSVQRDGRREDVRTIRYLRDDGDIDFFSPRPPPTMSVHVGRWSFEDHPGGCRTTARREYRLVREDGESASAYARRRRAYAERFADRLQAILDSFVAHYAAARQEVAA